MARRKQKTIAGKIAKVFFVFGLIMSVVTGSMLGYLVYNTGNALSLLNQDEKDTLSEVDLSKYNLNSDEQVINVLLVGADKNANEQNKDVERRSDTMMIATLDRKNGKLKVTSLMRDMYVTIPGYGKNKLNAAYSYGGIKLLYETISTNFNIKIDQYVEVNFDAFVNVIDKLDGVQLKLSESEAKHLNTTNYIKRAKYRNLKEGKQTLNGYQALGYCRIRHGKTVNGVTPAVYSLSGKADDYGRTERQRLLMNAIFKKIKNQPVLELFELAEVILPSVKTDIDDEKIKAYLKAIVEIGSVEIKQFRLPADGMFTSQMINGQSCLVPDYAANSKALKKFIFDS